MGIVAAQLAETWSPEQICGRLKDQGLPSVSHEAIYQYIYADKHAGGHSITRFVVRNSAGSDMGEENGAALSRTRFRSNSGLPLPTIAYASVTGKAAWLSGRGISRRSSRSTSASPAIR